VELDQKPDPKLTTGFQSHQQVAMMEGSTT
jgi:hypothetical protein